MSIASFSQSIYKVKNDTLLCFNKEQLKIIVNDLKQNNYNELLINELESKYILLDSLNNVYLEIIINRDKQITIQEKIISDLNSNIEDYKKLNIQTEEKYKQKIKKKNNTIIKLGVLNIITVAILIIALK